MVQKVGARREMRDISEGIQKRIEPSHLKKKKKKKEIGIFLFSDTVLYLLPLLTRGKTHNVTGDHITCLNYRVKEMNDLK